MKRLSALCAATYLLAIAPVSAQTEQASYPNRPVTWVVPFSSGSVYDNTARMIGNVLGDKLGQPVIIQNKPGASGIIGTQLVQQAKPDGYTMLYSGVSPLAIYPWLYKKLPYEPLKSFVPVNGVFDTTPILVVNSGKPYKTIREFVDYLKKNPGQVNYGATRGGLVHLTGEMLQVASGTSMQMVPYTESAKLYADLISGTIDGMFDFTATIRPYVEAGKVIPLAVASAQRLAAFPNVPTFKESGIDVDMTAWAVVVMPAGTPTEIVNKMSVAFAEAMRDPSVTKYMEQNNFGNLGSVGPDKLRDLIVHETAKYKGLVERSGVSLE
jgi:tripartite-type tricarboxylate transporter receptor subunit TctC